MFLKVRIKNKKVTTIHTVHKKNIFNFTFVCTHDQTCLCDCDYMLATCDFYIYLWIRCSIFTLDESKCNKSSSPSSLSSLIPSLGIYTCSEHHSFTIKILVDPHSFFHMGHTPGISHGDICRT